MPRDYTFDCYRDLLEAALQAGYRITSVRDYLEAENSDSKTIILRHDVDKKPHNSLRAATVERELGLKTTYYFRIVKESNVPEVIRKIAELGHEIGYHYEDMALARGDFDGAVRSFEENLTYFRTFYPVKTVCMHGSPLSKWNNRLIWKKIDYRDYDIIGEPYCDFDFSQTLYLTDSCRTWDGHNMIIRDKVANSHDVRVSSTFDLIDKLKSNEMPAHIMVNTHPQRWSTHFLEWSVEFVGQNIKNFVKRLVAGQIARRDDTLFSLPTPLSVARAPKVDPDLSGSR